MIATHNAQKKVGFSNSSPPISGSLIQHDVGNDQQVNRDAFDLFYYSIRKRMFLGRFTVAERTALHPDARRTLREMARMQGHLALASVYRMDASYC